LARQWTTAAIQSLGGIATNGESEAARVAACVALLDRGWGKAPQTFDEDGGDIRIVVRHIICGERPLKLVEQADGREKVVANASQSLPSSIPSDDREGG
jgi:hypothetical protein